MHSASMNMPAVEWALAQQAPSATAKLVLIAIASRVVGRELQASQAEIAAIVQMTDRSIRAALKLLEAAGLIKRRRNPGAGDGRCPDTITLEQPEPISADVRQPENASGATGTNFRGNRKTVPQQPEPISAELAEPISGEVVDNFGAHIEHAHARAETPITNTYTQVELYPERPSPSSTAAVVLNGRARSMPAHELARVAVDAVNSPWLDPHKSQKLITTAGRFQVWQQAGADFDTDILPTIRALCVRATEPIRTWTYFDNAIRAAIAQRIEAEAPMLPVTISEARNDYASRDASGQSPQITRGKISPGSAHYLRAREAARLKDEQRGLEPRPRK